MIKLRDDWKQIITRAWSVRFLVLAAILTGAEAALPVIGFKLPLSDWQLAGLTFGIVSAALYARIIAQKGFQ